MIRIASVAQNAGQVLGPNLNCSESGKQIVLFERVLDRRRLYGGSIKYQQRCIAGVLAR
jgi:hypothetical protein